MMTLKLMVENRYRVERSCGGFWPCIVVCGTGTRELFKGSRKNCECVAMELTTAYLDGAFVSQREADASHDAEESLGEIRKVSLHAAGDWPDLETDTHIVRRMKWLARYCNANPPAQDKINALRGQVRCAWLSGTDDFRRHYDAELLALIGVATFQDLYAP